MRPPRPNTKTTPSAKSIGVVRRIEPFQIVCSQLRKRTSAGTQMISVSDHEALAEQRAHAGHEHVVAVDDRREDA